MHKTPFAFDKEYYQKYYERAASRVTTKAVIRRLGNFVCGYLKHIEQPVSEVLDMGCGLGLWKKEIKSHYPKAKYTGVEYSDYLCDKYGWENGSVTNFKSKKKYDLIICQGVFQYLDNKEAEIGLTNLMSMCRGSLYFEILTKQDWENNCDQNTTDGKVYLRSIAWYRSRLKTFTNLGGGLFLSPKSNLVLYELEHI